MERLVIKCLNKREQRFELNSCPVWLSSLIPTRIKSVEPIIEYDNEQKSQPVVDLSPYTLVTSIPLLNEDKLNDIDQRKIVEKNSNFEYPNDASFENDLYRNYSQLIRSPSNQQLIYLFEKLKEFQKEKQKTSSHEILNQCNEINCSNRSIPLTSFCKRHLLEKDKNQILFVKCHHCQQIAIQHDNNAFLHFCSYLK